MSALVASSGGGVIGAYMGTLPAFILTDVIAIAGSVAITAGGADMTMGFVALGSYPDPHIAFVGGVATFAYAGRTKKLGSGADILSRLNGLTGPATLLAGGVFGVIGFLIHYLIGMVLHPNTDFPGSTVILSAIIARLMLGSGGFIGKAAPGESREYFTNGKGILCNVILGLGLGTTTGFVYQALLDDGASAAVIGNYPILCFEIAVVSLIPARTGLAMPATHHAVLISVLTAVSSRNPVMGTIFGILTILFGDFVGRTFSGCCDIHIDPPTSTIFVFTFVVNIVFGSEFFSV